VPPVVSRKVARSGRNYSSIGLEVPQSPLIVEGCAGLFFVNA